MDKKLKRIKEILILIEGGWGTTLNQNTKLTPTLVRKTVKLIEEFFIKFNKYAKENDLNEIEFMGPVGSVSYYEKDEQEYPEKEYGDIDCLVSISKDDTKTEYKNIQINYNNILEFVNKSNISFIVSTPESKTAGQFLMFKVDNEYVQVDLIFTFSHTKEWAKSRYKPEHNVKGALFGNLLSAVGEALNMSVQGYGVQQKMKDGIIVPFKTMKAELKTISVNPKEFMIDILRHVCGKHAKIDNELKKYSGFNPENVKIEDIAKSIKALAKSFEMNNTYGKDQLKEFKSQQDFLDVVANSYKAKMDKAIASTKFEKVTSEYGKEKAKRVKQQFDEVSKKVINLLK